MGNPSLNWRGKRRRLNLAFRGKKRISLFSTANWTMNNKLSQRFKNPSRRFNLGLRNSKKNWKLKGKPELRLKGNDPTLPRSLRGSMRLEVQLTLKLSSTRREKQRLEN